MLTVALLFSLALSAFAAQSPKNATKRATLANVIYSCTKKNTAALTFDDGPWIYENGIVDLLDAAGIKGTFCMNGNNYACIYEQPQTGNVQRTYAAGHQIVSHTWDHADLTTISSSQITTEITWNDLAFQRILGVVPAFLRPPYGDYNDNVREIAYANGKQLLMWDFDSLDSDGDTLQQSETLYDQLVASHPSTVLALNHETEETTARSLVTYAINKLKGAGYNLVTVAECLGGVPAYTSVGSPIPGTYSCSNPGGGSTGGGGGTGGSGQIHPNGDTSWCVDTAGNAYGNGVAVTLQPCSSVTVKWALSSGDTTVTTDNGAYSFDSGNSPTSGTLMKIWQAYGTGLANQNWYLTDDNRIALTNQGLCLDLPSGNKAAGQRLQLWRCTTGNTNQIWTLS
jgi:peptidoglycan/xylan/chitin deacetylase (PgdA/CDA1 family)